MPRNPKKNYLSPSKLFCPIETCRKECRTYAGLTQHIHAKHTDYQRGTPPSASAIDSVVLNIPDSSDSESDFLSYVSSTMIPPDSAQGFDHYSDFEFRLRSSLPRDSPSRESETSKRSDATEYHPLINGLLLKYIHCVYLHLCTR